MINRVLKKGFKSVVIFPSHENENQKARLVIKVSYGQVNEQIFLVAFLSQMKVSGNKCLDLLT